MKKTISIIFLSISLLTSYVLASTFPNQNVQTNLKKDLFQLNVDHRFLTSISDEPLGNFFGLDGLNTTKLKLTYAAQDNLHLSLARSTVEKEFTFDTTYKLPPMQGIIPTVGLEFFSFKEGDKSRQQNFFYYINGHYPNIIEKLTPVLSMGIDGFNNHLGFAFGANYEVRNDINVSAEWIESKTVSGNEHSLFLNAIFTGDIYNFTVMLGNNQSLSFRRNLEGAPSKDLTLGFKLSRSFDWISYFKK